MLGLSQTTVSRAINGYPEVNEDTRVRVVSAAKKYNYRPNASAARLATGRTMAVGHVLPVSSKHEMVNPISADFVAGAGETCRLAGYDILLSVVNDEDQQDAVLTMARTGNVDGLIVVAPIADDPRIEALSDIGLPFIVHGRSSNESAVHSWLDVNNRRAFMQAASELAELGHERIGLINGLDDRDFAMRRRAGYEDALSARGLAIDEGLIRSSEMMEPYGHVAVQEMMRLADPPSAFLISSVLPAIGARRALQDLGLEIGKDVSIIVFDDDLSYFKNDGNVPPFTAMRSSTREAGKRCAEILLQAIQRPGAAPVQELWEAVYVPGSSTCAAPDKRQFRQRVQAAIMNAAGNA